jgi:uroporphyrinogen-III synthase
MRVLITQSAQDARASAEALAARGHDVLAVPLVAAERQAPAKVNLAAAQGFIVTSSDGAHALSETVGVRTFPVFADSEVTAAALRKLGFKNVFAAKDDSADLARLVERSVKPANGALIYACSTAAPVNLPAMLSNMGFAVRPLPLYTVRRTEQMPENLRAALEGRAVDAALFLTADEARAFVALIQRAEMEAAVRELPCVAASPVVAAPLRALKLGGVSVPQAADLDAVFGALDVKLVDKVEEERAARETRAREEEERLRREQAEREKLAKESAEKERAERERVAAENAAREKAARETAEREHLAREAAERERLEQKRRADEQAEKDRQARRLAEEQRLTAEKAAKEKAAAERAERESAERERLAAEKAARGRIAAEKAAVERAERERLAAERAEREKLERERLAAERAERERISTETAAREKAERDRIAREMAEQHRIEGERLAAERAERDRIAAEQIAAARTEQERLDLERTERKRKEQERLALEKAERDRLAREKALAERAERERIAQERAEQDRIAREQRAAEKAEQDRITFEKAEAERFERERLARERAAQDRAQQERLALEKSERDRIAKEKAETERLERERIAAERAVQDRIEQERRAAEKAEQDRVSRERAEAETAERARAAQERAERRSAEKEREAREKAEQMAERERRAQEEKERRAAEKVEVPPSAAGWRTRFKGLFGAAAPQESVNPVWTMAIGTVNPTSPPSTPPVIAPAPVARDAPSATMDTPIAAPVLRAEPPVLVFDPPAPETTPQAKEVHPVSDPSPPPASASGAPPPAPSSGEPPISASEGKSPRGGGRAARLQAEDAADLRAKDQRFKYLGHSEQPAPEPEPERASVPPHGASTATQAPRQSRGGAGRTLGLFVILVVAAAAVMGTSSWWVPRVTALMQGTAVVQQGEPANTASSFQADINALKARVGVLEQEAVNTVTPDALNAAKQELAQRLAALEARAGVATPDGEAFTSLGDSLSSQAKQLTAVSARLATLEAAIGNSARLEDLSRRLGMLEGRSAEASSVLALSDRVTTLEGSARRTMAEQSTNIALLMAVAQWREAVLAGHPFRLELETVKALAARGSAIVIDDTGFAADAEKGIATLAELQRRFRPIAAAVMRASAIPDDTAPWYRRILDRAFSIISVRRLDGDAAGTGVSAVLARAEARLTEGDLAAAVTEMNTLTGSAATTAAPWLTIAKARVAAERAAAEATTKTVGLLAAMAKTPEATPPASSGP